MQGRHVLAGAVLLCMAFPLLAHGQLFPRENAADSTLAENAPPRSSAPAQSEAARTDPGAASISVTGPVEEDAFFDTTTILTTLGVAAGVGVGAAAIVPSSSGEAAADALSNDPNQGHGHGE